MPKVTDDERREARALLKDLSHQGDSEALLACLEMDPFDNAHELRLRAVRAALSVMRAQGDKGGLVAALSDDRLVGDRWFEREAFHAAVEQLIEEKDPDGFLALLDEPVVHDSAERRARVVHALQHRPARDEPKFVESCGAECITRLCDLLEKDPDAKVRFEAAQALVERADASAAPALVRALKDESSDVRGPAIVGVGKLRPREAISDLVGLLDAEGFFGRRLVAASLIEIRDERALPLLQQVAGNGRRRSTRRLAKKTAERLSDAVGISQTHS